MKYTQSKLKFWRAGILAPILILAGCSHSATPPGGSAVANAEVVSTTTAAMAAERASIANNPNIPADVKAKILYYRPQ